MTLASDPAVLSFRDAAERYCGLIRGFGEWELDALWPELEKALIELYARVLALPAVEPGTDDLVPVAVHEDERSKLFRDLHAHFGPHAFYSEVYDPIERSADDVLDVGIADDLVDIYRDLSGGLEAWDPTDPARTADVVWDWRYAFESHWGQHLVDALRAIHWLRHVHYHDAPEDRDPAF